MLRYNIVIVLVYILGVVYGIGIAFFDIVYSVQIGYAWYTTLLVYW